VGRVPEESRLTRSLKLFGKHCSFKINKKPLFHRFVSIENVTTREKQDSQCTCRPL
jgi:hypothetical protein